MGLRINDTVPNFTAETDQGTDPVPRLDRRQLGDPVQPPQGFHPGLHDRVRRRRAAGRRMGKARHQGDRLSVDGVEEHVKWKGDIEVYAGAKAGFPIIADEDLAVSKAFDMLPADAYLPDGRTPADSASVRSVFIIAPDKKLQAVDDLPDVGGPQLRRGAARARCAAGHLGKPMATPANWDHRPGRDRGPVAVTTRPPRKSSASSTPSCPICASDRRGSKIRSGPA
jgi:alkyl hydroperoxide reductase subunit AhpC